MTTDVSDHSFDIILVHGTILGRRRAKRPRTDHDVYDQIPWTDATKNDSLAARLVTLKSNGRRGNISALPWTGYNTARAREEAADRLRQQIEM